MHIFHIPQSTIKKIESIVRHFLWLGSGTKRRTPLVGLNLISRPIKNGGWGLLNLKNFNLAHSFANLWRNFEEQGLWQKVMVVKYLHNRDWRNGLAMMFHPLHVSLRLGEAYRAQSLGFAVTLFGLLAMVYRSLWGWIPSKAC